MPIHPVRVQGRVNDNVFRIFLCVLFYDYGMVRFTYRVTFSYVHKQMTESEWISWMLFAHTYIYWVRWKRRKIVVYIYRLFSGWFFFCFCKSQHIYFLTRYRPTYLYVLIDNGQSYCKSLYIDNGLFIFIWIVIDSTYSAAIGMLKHHILCRNKQYSILFCWVRFVCVNPDWELFNLIYLEKSDSIFNVSKTLRLTNQ